MIRIFAQQPIFEQYVGEAENTMNVFDYFYNLDPSNNNLDMHPSGLINNELFFEDRKVPTPLVDQMRSESLA